MEQAQGGEYVSNKEFLYLVLGVGNSMCAASASYNLTFTAGCMFVGAIYGLKMMDFAMLGIVNLVLNYLFAPINMIITDNLGTPPKKTMRWIHMANIAFIAVGAACFLVPQQYFEGFMPALPQVLGTKFIMQAAASYYNMLIMRKLTPRFGKYRCWVVANFLPNVLSLLLLVWFPYNTLEYHSKFWVMNLFFSIWGTFASCFGQTNNIPNVISPNSNERTKIFSFGAFLWSLFPSIYNILWPLLAAAVGGMTHINTYRIVVPALVVLFGIPSLFLAFGVKDRVVQEDNHRPDVNLKKGMREVFRNKYLWITNVGTWLATLSTGVINVINMVIIYDMRADWVMAITSTILGTASVPGMFAAPYLIKRFGKKKIYLATRYLSLLCSALTVVGVIADSVLILVASTYISTVFGMTTSIATSSMTADIWDYQQYISGERLDGCMGFFGYFSAPITTVFAMLVPYLYGLVGFTSDWNILYDPEIRTSVFLITIGISSVAGLLSIIPYHFYDLSEEKHKKIIEELQARAEAEKAAKNAGEEMSV